MSGVGVVLNPHARGNRRRPGRVEGLRRVVGDDGEVSQTESLADLERVIERYRDTGVDCVAVCGGDGTLFRTVSAIVRAWGDRELPLVLPLRAGTINVVAGSVGLRRGTPEAVLAAVLESRRRGAAPKVVERELIAANGEHYGFLFGLGLIVNYLRRYYEAPNPGPLRAAALVARLSASVLRGGELAAAALAPVGAAVEVDGQDLPFDRLTFLLGMTIEHLPLGFRVGPRATERPGSFQLLGGPIAGPRIVRHLPRFFLGKAVVDAGLFDGLAARVRIRFTEPTHFMFDADILGPVEALELRAGPRLRLVVA